MKPKSRIIKLPSLHVELLMDGLDRDLNFIDTCLVNMSTNEASMTGAVAAIQTSCHMKQLLTESGSVAEACKSSRWTATQLDVQALRKLWSRPE